MESLPKWPDQQGLKILWYSTLWRTGWEPSSLFSMPLGRDWTGPVFVGPVMGHPSKEGKYRPQERFDFPNLTGSLGIKGAKVKLTTPPKKPSTALMWISLHSDSQRPPRSARARMGYTDSSAFQHHQYETSYTARSLFPYSFILPTFPQTQRA